MGVTREDSSHAVALPDNGHCFWKIVEQRCGWAAVSMHRQVAEHQGPLALTSCLLELLPHPIQLLTAQPAPKFDESPLSPHQPLRTVLLLHNQTSLECWDQPYIDTPTAPDAAPYTPFSLPSFCPSLTQGISSRVDFVLYIGTHGPPGQRPYEAAQKVLRTCFAHSSCLLAPSTTGLCMISWCRCLCLTSRPFCMEACLSPWQACLQLAQMRHAEALRRVAMA